MVLRPEPVAGALDCAAPAPDSTVILLDPAGELFRQARADDLARGRTSSSSARATRASTSGSAALVDLELSIGDYVLTGGELPALVVVDAVMRLLPGRHRRGLDRGGVVRGRPPRVPAVHASGAVRAAGASRRPRGGDHGAVRRWRLRSRSRRTLERRPDLLDGGPWTPRSGRCWRRSDADADARRNDERRTRGQPPGDGCRRTAAGCACYTPPSVAHARPLHHALDAARGQRAAAHRSRGPPVNVLDEIVQDQLRTDLPELAPGDTVKVSAKVVEGNRERIQVFEGTVMRLRGGGITRSDHRPADRQRRRRGADLQGEQPADREDRGRPPRRGPPRPAVLPPQARRQGRDAARAARQLP